MKTSRVLRSSALVLLAIGFVATGHADAQGPVQGPPPTWLPSGPSQSMVLNPTTAKLGVGTLQPVARLHVVGTEMAQTPGSGYLVLGSRTQLHMQLDRNDIRVSGPSADTVGNLYLQRYGGPVRLHTAQETSKWIVFPNEGGLAVGAADPQEFAVAAGFKGPSWDPVPAIAVDGYVYADQVWTNEGRFHESIHVGPRADGVPGGARDYANLDAVAMIGGKLTAHEIIVHINQWADDVFDDDYPLRSLEETKDFIQQNHHLPDVPPEAELRAEGLDLAEMNATLLRKVEELTLHAIEQGERIERLEASIDACD